MENLNIRIARITKLVKHNATNNASNIRWVWKEEVYEQLQFKDSDGEWKKVPVVNVYDESEKTKEKERENKSKLDALNKKQSVFEFLKSLENPKEYWHSISQGREYGTFLDCESAELSSSVSDDGYTYYYGKNGLCARFKDGKAFVRGDLFMDFLNPLPRIDYL